MSQSQNNQNKGGDPSQEQLQSYARGFTLRQLEKVQKQPGQKRFGDTNQVQILNKNEKAVLSDDEQDEMLNIEQREKRRFGYEIKKDRTKISNFLKITGVLIAILFIPLQIFLKAVLQDYEANKLVELQQYLKPKEDSVGMIIMAWIIKAFDTRPTMAVAMFLFLATDSFIAFKSTFLYFTGLWLIILLKMLYESPRPFWVDHRVHVFRQQCDFDYASPSTHLFNLWFFYGYTIFMYLYKYSADINYKLVYLSYSILLLIMLITSFAMYAFGILFIYQSFVSILYSVSFNILCINFDQIIVTQCEKIGFIIQTSRQMKFIVLFWCLGFLMFAVLIYTSQLNNWADQQYWVINVKNQNVCSKELFKPGATRLGGQDTFSQSSYLFYIIGLAFGTSYSLLEVDCFDFVHTHWAKKLLRAIIGCALAEGIYAIFSNLVSDTSSTFLTRYCFEGAFPNFLVPFIIYGPFQVFCKWIKLVDIDSSQDEDDKNEQLKTNLEAYKNKNDDTIDEFADNQNDNKKQIKTN